MFSLTPASASAASQASGMPTLVPACGPGVGATDRPGDEPGVEARQRADRAEDGPDAAAQRLVHVEDRPALGAPSPAAPGPGRSGAGGRCWRGTRRPRRRWRSRSSRQVDVVLAGEAAYGLGLGLAPEELADHPAGEHAVLDLELGAEDVVDAELARDRLGLEPGRGRGQHDDVPHPLVRLDDRARLRPDRAGDLLHEEPLAHLLQLVLAVPAQRAELTEPGRVGSPPSVPSTAVSTSLARSPARPAPCGSGRAGCGSR